MTLKASAANGASSEASRVAGLPSSPFWASSPLASGSMPSIGGTSSGLGM